MSHVEQARAAYDAFGKGDIEAAFADLADGCVFHGESADLPAGGDYTGRDDILGRWLPELGGTYQDMSVVPDTFIDGGGEHVIVMGAERATVNGTPTGGRFCHVWRYEGDKVAEAWFFGDTAQTERALASSRAASMN